MQGLWQQQLNWDDPVPFALHENGFHPYLIIELHGFLDPSNEAFGACLYYIRSIKS